MQRLTAISAFSDVADPAMPEHRKVAMMNLIDLAVERHYFYSYKICATLIFSKRHPAMGIMAACAVS